MNKNKQVSKILRGNVKYLYTPFGYGHARCLVLDAGKTGLAGIKAQTVLSRSRIGNSFHRCGDHVNVVWAA